MSRAINISETVQVVTDACERHAVAFTTMEPLESGGTRVVCLNSDGADLLRRKMKTKILSGPVVRSGLYASRGARRV
ncbi:MAG: hypothetical protein JJE34_09290 [Alphaproteobacteria bacterium]|nr:hypothetical protein [Alphaproteobacteria bacterium]